MRGNSENTLKEVIDKLIKTYRLSDKLNEVNLNDAWHKIAGEMISRHTCKIYFSNHKLFVEVDSPVIRQELAMEKTSIIEKLNNYFSEPVVYDVTFIISSKKKKMK